MRALSYYFMLFRTLITPTKTKRKEIRCDYTKKHNIYNNKIILFDDKGNETEVENVSGLAIDFSNCKENIVRVHKKTKFSGSKINFSCANNCLLEFEETPRINGLSLSVACGNNQKLHWGKNSTLWHANIFIKEEGSGLVVGRDCMFSHDITIWTTDGHAIIDRETKQTINHIKSPVVIGDKCWIGQHAVILKSAQIPNNTIVGNSAVVAKKFDEEYTVLAGNPAKVIKRGVEWDERTAAWYNRDNNSAQTVLMGDVRGK